MNKLASLQSCDSKLKEMSKTPNQEYFYSHHFSSHLQVARCDLQVSFKDMLRLQCGKDDPDNVREVEKMCRQLIQA